MDRYALLSDQELDELLQGRAPEGRPDLNAVADLAAAVRSRAVDEPAPVMAYELRRAISDRARPPAPAPEHPRWRHGLVAGAAVVAFGAVGVAGALPAPVQDAVAGAGRVVGVELPRSDDAADEAPGVQVATSVLEDGDDGGREPTPSAPPDHAADGAEPAEPTEPGSAGDREPLTPAAPTGARADDQEPREAAGDRERGPGNAADGAPAPEDAGPHERVAPADRAPEQPNEDDEPAEVHPPPVRPRLS